MTLLELLVEKKIIEKEALPEIKELVRRSGGNLDEVLAARGVNPEDVLSVKGEYYGIPIKSLGDQTVSFDVLKFIPEESALHYKFVPIGLAEGVLEVGIVDPDNIEARDALNFISTKISKPYKVFLIGPSEFDKIAKTYRGLSGEVTEALTELETELSDTIAVETGKKEPGASSSTDEEGAPLEVANQTKIIEDAPVTKIVATILNYATQGNASDIHVEHMEDKIRVRFRVDGALNTSLILPTKIHSAIVARIKILCNMRLDEKRKPQDGRFSAKVEGRKVDFRVSTFPSYYGEKIVMRILDSDRGVKALDEMGLVGRNLRLVREAINKPYGLILVSGPTGSGKSTTLYSMLKEIDKETQNVLSLEDPVEYNVPGMNQSQVRPEIGYTFANGLRSTLRQDPDIIMVGEIRDKETAQLAVQAALTGHLVLSTIHTNNAAGVIPRLIDMGVDPFLIAPTLVLAMAQRLVRTLCPNSGKPVPVDDSIKLIIDSEFKDIPEAFRSEIPVGDTVYEIEPTPACPKGTSGRTAVFEVIDMTKELEKVILKDPTEIEVTKTARNQGMFTMKEDAIIKAFKRSIPFEEVNKL
jgi:type IV pilus assembly protein PilB